MQVEFYYDLVSPYSYLAYGQIGRICEETRAGARTTSDAARRRSQGGGDKGPDRDEAQGQIPGARHPSLGRVLRGVAEVSGPLPVSYSEDDAGGDVLEERDELEAYTDAAFALYWEEGGAPKGLEEVDEDAPISAVSQADGG